MREFLTGAAITVGLILAAGIGAVALMLLSSQPWAPMLATFIVGYAVGTVFGLGR